MTTIYKSFADLATAIGPVMPTTKEIEGEYGPAIDPIPSTPEGPRVFKRYELPEESPEDFSDQFWKKWSSDFANWLTAGASFFDFDERSQFDPIQFVDKVLQGLERWRDTTEDAGHQTSEEIKSFDRMDNGTEIDIERLRRLITRKELLGIKWQKANRAFKAGLVARHRVVGQAMSGPNGLKNVDEYMSLERLAGVHRTKRERERRDFAAMKAAEKLLGMTPTQLREHQNRTRLRLLDSTLANMANGIDADDGNGAGRFKITGTPTPSEAVTNRAGAK